MLKSILDWRHLRKYPKPLAEPHTVIYDWRPYRGFHILGVFEGALRIGADPDDRIEDILQRIPPSVDTFLFNLDLSSTEAFPKDRQRLVRELRARGIDVWNAAVTDTTKRKVQAVCLQAGIHGTTASQQGNSNQIVIIKSNANYAGRAERKLSARQREQLGITISPLQFDTKQSYQILSRRQVPAECWHDPNLAIERFITNQEGIFYRARFVFDLWFVSRCFSNQAIKSTGNSARMENFAFHRGEPVALPAGLLDTSIRFISAFGIDYGALDVIPDDHGDFYVIDVNATPGLSSIPEEQAIAFRQGWQERRQLQRGRRAASAASSAAT